MDTSMSNRNQLLNGGSSTNKKSKKKQPQSSSLKKYGQDNGTAQDRLYRTGRQRLNSEGYYANNQDSYNGNRFGSNMNNNSSKNNSHNVNNGGQSNGKNKPNVSNNNNSNQINSNSSNNNRIKLASGTQGINYDVQLQEYQKDIYHNGQNKFERDRNYSINHNSSDRNSNNRANPSNNVYMPPSHKPLYSATPSPNNLYIPPMKSSLTPKSQQPLLLSTQYYRDNGMKHRRAISREFQRSISKSIRDEDEMVGSGGINDRGDNLSNNNNPLSNNKLLVRNGRYDIQYILDKKKLSRPKMQGSLTPKYKNTNTSNSNNNGARNNSIRSNTSHQDAGDDHTVKFNHTTKNVVTQASSAGNNNSSQRGSGNNSGNSINNNNNANSNKLTHNLHLVHNSNNNATNKQFEAALVLTPQQYNKFGDRFPDKFKKIALLGRGGFSVVWLGVHLTSKKKVAIKQILTKNPHQTHLKQIWFGSYFFEKGGQAREQFQNHIGINNLCRLLSHQISSLDSWLYYQTCQESLGSCLFDLRSQVVNGEKSYKISYRDLVKKIRSNLSQLKHLIIQVSKALLLINGHNMVHSDLKTQNILIKRNRSETDDGLFIKQLKLIDFGSSFLFSNLKQFSMATPEYMPPQILNYILYQNKLEYNKEMLLQMQRYSNPWVIDMWSLGCIVLEIVSGVPLWMSLPTKIQNTPHRATGLFAAKGRLFNKIIVKQVEVINQLERHLILSNHSGIQLDAQIIKLLKRMLDLDPEKRISPSQLLKQLGVNCPPQKLPFY